jgi:adenylyltransferase/sulfurtransferase
MSVSFMKRGSVIVVEPKDEADAISLYNELLGKTISKPAN